MSENKQIKEKTCFVIMPISDIDSYDIGHFTRVYNHLVKPSCEKAGYRPVRADDVVASNYIVIDILSKILESDIVVCDLSGRNPNVLYELGIRQAFNLPTVLIKDGKTDKIFDIQGLRYIEYDHTLRIDNVQLERDALSKSLTETEKNRGTDVNSLIQLLGVKPASLPSKVELSNESSVILSAIHDLAKRISSLEENKKKQQVVQAYPIKPALINFLKDGKFKINGEEIGIGDNLFVDGNVVGELIDVFQDTIVYKDTKGNLNSIDIRNPEFTRLAATPF